MERFNIFFEQSAFWIIPALLIAAFLAWLLYRKTTTFDSQIKKALGVLRFLLISILLILLISPVIRQIINHYEKPVVVVALDNSTSVMAYNDSTAIINFINSVDNSLEDEFTIEYRTLDNKPDDVEQISFNKLTTNLHDLFSEINNDYENRNLAAVILLSDGIFNQGLNPVYSKYAYPVYSLGLGDTTIYPDLGIHQLRYNKLSYQGNKLPIQVDISYQSFKGGEATVSISKDGDIIEKRTVHLNNNKGIHSELFHIEAKAEGLQHYQIAVNSPAEERNTANNKKSAFIDVVEGKKNILLIAPRPHPDIKALEAAISINKNYEFIQYIPVLGKENVQQILNQPVDLVIMHQLPNAQMMNDPVYKKFVNSENSKWWITGSDISYTFFNQVSKSLQINQSGSQTDNVTAWFSEDFSAFTLSEELRNIFNSLPPVKVPFGNVDINPEANVFLYQQVGRVQTQKPLFVTSASNDIREGVFLGDGLWQWRLYEYAQHQTHDRFNELISKTIQYLSTREDKRKFRFYPVKNEFNEGEQVIFESEIYNELYEPVYGQEIQILLTNSEGQNFTYQYVTSEGNSRYAISGLLPGIYSYSARTVFNGTPMEVKGEIAINRMDFENLRLTADYDLLKQISSSSGGKFYPFNNHEELVQELNGLNFSDRIQSSEDFLPLINIKWLGIILLLLVSSEWILRKYHGAY